MANPKPKPEKSKRATTAEVAERVLEKASDKPKPRTDDPARDEARIEDGVLEPLPHAD